MNPDVQHYLAFLDGAITFDSSAVPSSSSAPLSGTDNEDSYSEDSDVPELLGYSFSESESESEDPDAELDTPCYTAQAVAAQPAAQLLHSDARQQQIHPAPWQHAGASSATPSYPYRLKLGSTAPSPSSPSQVQHFPAVMIKPKTSGPVTQYITNAQMTTP